MFRRYPYKGWLIISILLWCVAGFRYYTKSEAVKPAGMARAVSENLQDNQKSFNSILADQALIERIYTDQLSPGDVERLSSLPYYIYAYNGSLKFWSSNEMLTDCINSAHEKSVLLSTEKGYFVKSCYSPNADKHRKLVVAYPILTRYPFDNSYLKSHFEAADYIPLNTEIATRAKQGSHPVYDINNQVAFYLSFTVSSIPEWMPGKPFLWMLAFAMLTSIIWLQLVTIYITRKRSPVVGFVFTVAAVVGLRALTYIWGMPFNLDTLPIFSPRLYASSSFLPSLGDLMLNALCALWIVVFMIRHIPTTIFDDLQLPKSIKFVIGIMLSVLLIYIGFGFLDIIRSVVVDSMISFDVSHFYSITFYTLAGLGTIGIITGSSCLAIYFINQLISGTIDSKWVKYTVITLLSFLFIWMYKGSLSDNFLYILLIWLLLFVILLDIHWFTHIIDLLAPQIIFWASFVCIFCTGVIQYFSNLKEHETRKAFAEQVVKQRDYVTEYAFQNISQIIRKDPVLRNFMQHPSAERRRIINERFDALYLGGQLNNYESKVLLFNKEGEALFNTDTLSLHKIESEKKYAELSTDSNLYYKPFAEDGRYYFAEIPVAVSNDTIGTVIIDLAVKESANQTVYPELLRPGSIKIIEEDAGYSYGVYVKNKLITQTADYSVPVRGYYTTEEQHTFYNWENSSELWHKVDDNRTVLVIRYNRIWLESITLFSYLFGIQMLIVGIIILYRLYLSYFIKPKSATKFINLTLRKRIHFAMLAVVLVSFAIIGLVTIVYFNVQYKQNSKKKLQGTMHFIEQALMQYLNNHNGLEDEASFNDVIQEPGFKYLVTNISNVQKADINVYKSSGLLGITSQDNIYDKFLLARIIRPDAYYQLRNQNKPLVIQNERIGKLSYMSCYVPLRDNAGAVVGYINVPFFSSQKELNFQISNILVALINLSAIIFLISSTLSVFITRWLTRTLSVVINRFEKFSLTKNELIEWPYEDEIGTLVNEYNKMVKKVEENALQLAQNEREMAWREMARQVAHEIKNPLTPMKLNIQYLQQAIKSGYPNVQALAAKVSESLIEQIDNLSYIASEFSNFAKMPEARPEEIELNELLQKGVELYLNEPNVKVSMIDTIEALIVFADKSQLIRMLSNLLENAVQSIDENFEGHVTVTLIKEGSDALITIKDDGEGIPEEVREKIFQPYFTTKTSGTGLGLAMTKKIIEFWKGRIWFETETGKGTTFFIRLPLVRKDEAEEEE